ncbi:MAG: hypothetical protein R2850_01690 [Bacteroidia bacterium]
MWELISNNKVLPKLVLLSAYLAISAYILFNFDGTGDSADSITHYLFARYAPEQHELFFNHWAKPLFVILASPFARLGFTGIKIFNILLNTITILFTIKTAENTGVKSALLSGLIVVCSPLFFVLGFSGLTEPLFACMLSVSLYLATRNKHFSAAALVSFLPFVRSEGLIIAGVFGLFFLIKRNLKVIPLLTTGHLVFSIAGSFYYGDLLWVFNKIPYAHLSSIYGEGDIFHFFRQLLYLTGVPNYFLLWSGCLVMLYQSVRHRLNSELSILVLGGFLAFFIAHTIFRAFGIFNSMGLIRVFIAVIPLMAIIATKGAEGIASFLPNKWRNIFVGVLSAYILVFPFTKNHASIHPKTDFNLSTDQIQSIELCKRLSDQIDINRQTFIYSHPYLSYCLNINHFDPQKHEDPQGVFPGNIEPGYIFIWDCWFTPVHHQISLEQVRNSDEFREILAYGGEQDTNFVVFRRIKR